MPFSKWIFTGFQNKSAATAAKREKELEIIYVRTYETIELLSKWVRQQIFEIFVKIGIAF